MAQRDRPKAPEVPPENAADEGATFLAEPTVEDIPAPDTAKPVPPAPPAPSQPSLFLPALGGGMLAAAIGFGLSHFNVLGLTAAAPDLSSLEARLSGIENGLAQNIAEVAKLAATPSAVDPAVSDRIIALETAITETVSDPRLDDLITRMDALDTQLADAATAGTGASGAAIAALQADLRALKSAAPVAGEDLSVLVTETKAALADATALAAETKVIAADARMTAALGQLRAALDTGQAYTAALAMLQGSDIPAALSDHAATGLPTLSRLQDGFPVAARAALDAALRASPGESWTDRVGTFLRSQTGARATTPRDGDDPDAILSRAEAALAKADLDTALQEVATLPDAAKAAMVDWTGLAEQRRAGAGAIAALAAKAGG